MYDMSFSAHFCVRPETSPITNDVFICSSMIGTLCPTTCHVVDDDAAITQLVETHVPEYSGVVTSCQEALAVVDCMDAKYGKYLRELCPCSCSEQTVRFLTASR